MFQYIFSRQAATWEHPRVSCMDVAGSLGYYRYGCLLLAVEFQSMQKSL